MANLNGTLIHRLLPGQILDFPKYPTCTDDALNVADEIVAGRGKRRSPSESDRARWYPPKDMTQNQRNSDAPIA